MSRQAQTSTATTQAPRGLSGRQWGTFSRQVHLRDPDQPQGNMTVLVSVIVVFDSYGQESFKCVECRSDSCAHCGAVFDQLCEEGVINA